MRSKIMIALLTLILGILNYDIYRKEQIKRHGEIVLLELAKVHPSVGFHRYMQLRYVIEQESLKNPLSVPVKKGYIVIRTNHENVAEFCRFHAQEPLAADEKLISFSPCNWHKYGFFRISPNAFFTEKTHETYHQGAKYAMFQFDKSGHYLIVGLANAGKNQIRVK